MIRSKKLDLIRTIAFVFVIGIHSYAWIGYNAEINDGMIMLLLAMLRTVFNSCVPLFLLLSGALRGGTGETSRITTSGFFE